MEVSASLAADPAAIDRVFNQESQGHLTDRGRREAELVARRLGQERVHAIYSSPLHRAFETAEVSAAALGLEVQVTGAIAEVRTGALLAGSPGARWVSRVSASSLPPIAKRALLGSTLIPLYYREWRGGRTVGGETARELDTRVATFLTELEAAHPTDATVALFAHGYLLVTLTLALGGRARLALLRRPYIPNGAICEMELRDGRLRSVTHADARHLAAPRPRP